MEVTAYVVCWFNIVAGVPVFSGVAISPENAQSIRGDGEFVVPLDVMSGKGKDFLDAVANIIGTCKQFRHLLWLLPHLPKLKG
jgi:hypothetical protein